MLSNEEVGGGAEGREGGEGGGWRSVVVAVAKFVALQLHTCGVATKLCTDGTGRSVGNMHGEGGHQGEVGVSHMWPPTTKLCPDWIPTHQRDRGEHTVHLGKRLALCWKATPVVSDTLYRMRIIHKRARPYQQ